MNTNPMMTLDSDINDDEALDDISRIESKKSDPPKFIFDSIKLRFGYRRFVKLVCVHLFLPFSIPFADSVFNQSLVAPSHAYLHFLYPLCVIVMVIVNIYNTITMGENYPLRYCAIYPFMFYFSHRVMIGLKYATMSSVEYKRIVSNKDPALRLAYSSQSQIVTGWLQRNDDVLEFEIVSAALRNGIRLDTTFIHLQDHSSSKKSSIALLCWKSLLKNGNHVTVDENVSGVVKDSGDG